jgi:cytochrome c
MKLMLAFVVGITIAAGSVFTLSAQAKKSQWDGVYTAEQAKRGGETFQLKCASCHGKELAGYAMESTPAPPLTGPEFDKNWDDFPLSDLYDKIKMLMPQDEPGTLTDQQVSEVIAFILQTGKYPAGTTEMSSNHDQLAAIKFLAKKPGA